MNGGNNDHINGRNVWSPHELFDADGQRRRRTRKRQRFDRCDEKKNSTQQWSSLSLSSVSTTLLVWIAFHTIAVKGWVAMSKSTMMVRPPSIVGSSTTVQNSHHPMSVLSNRSTYRSTSSSSQSSSSVIISAVPFHNLQTEDHIREQQQSIRNCRISHEIELTLRQHYNTLGSSSMSSSPRMGDRNDNDTSDDDDGDDEIQLERILSSLHFDVIATAFRHLTSLMLYDSNNKNRQLLDKDSNDKSATTPTSTHSTVFLSQLVEGIAKRLILSRKRDRHHNKTLNSRNINERNIEETLSVAALFDVIQALTNLSRIEVINNQSIQTSIRTKQRRQFPSSSSSPSPVTRLMPLTEIVVNILNSKSPNELYRIGSTRLVGTLQSLVRLGLYAPSLSLSSSTQDQLLTTILHRLDKGDALSKLTPKSLVTGLQTLIQISILKSSSSSSSSKDMPDYNETTNTKILVVMRSFMRRLIKAKVRRQIPVDDWFRCLDAIRRFKHEISYDQVSRDSNNLNSPLDIEHELDQFVYSVLRAVIELKKQDFRMLEEHDNTLQRYDTDSHPVSVRVNKSTSPWTPAQFSLLVSSWSQIDPSLRNTTMLSNILDIEGKEHTLERCSFWKLSDITWALTGRDDKETNRKLNNLISKDHQEFVASMGKQFHRLIMDDSTNGHSNIPTDATIHKILRWSTIMEHQQRQLGQTEDSLLFKSGANILCRDTKFLQKCDLDQISTFVWYLGSSSRHMISMTQEEHDNTISALLCLGERLIEIESTASSEISPALSISVLSRFTSAVRELPQSQSNEVFDSLDDMTANIFDSFGPTMLLSHSLTPAQALAALKAYAHATAFVYDEHKGIIDHLVSLLAYSEVENLTSQQLSESLWSCGKLFALETNKTPPYFEQCLLLARELAARPVEMSIIDCAQSVWALGSLNVKDKRLMSALVTHSVQSEMEPGFVEISNILWGMCQVQFRDVRILDAIVNRLNVLMDTDSAIESHEASSILYSLGRLGFRDIDIFNGLAQQIIDQIDSTTAQSVANTLYAFQVAKLKPPPQLFDMWANKQLGIVGVVVPTMHSADENDSNDYLEDTKTQLEGEKDIKP